MADSYDYLFKFLIIGDTCVGKTCIMNYFVEGKFKDTNHTVGVEFGTKLCTITDATIKIQIWDTAGQERFRAVTKSYYRGAIGVLLVYDITNRESFNHLTSWLTDAKSLTYGGCVIVLVGNKKDKEDEREVTFLEASRFAQEHGLVFMETSAITGINVEDAFYKCAKTILFRIESGDIDPENSSSGIQIGHNTNLFLTEKKQFKCC